jgi:hypothetical protein
VMHETGRCSYSYCLHTSVLDVSFIHYSSARAQFEDHALSQHQHKTDLREGEPSHPPGDVV